VVRVRRFEVADAPTLAALMTEMAGFYGATLAPGLDVAADLVRQVGRVEILLAEDDRDLLGFVTFAALYPVAGLLAFTYVQQVYVAQAARRRGVAQALMAEVARVAKAAGIVRVEWSTGAENTAARALYDGFGGGASDKVHYVLEGAPLDALAARR